MVRDDDILDDGWDAPPEASRGHSKPRREKDDCSPTAESDSWSVRSSDDSVQTMTTAAIVEAVQSGRLTPAALVWRSGLADWMQLSRVPLFRVLARRGQTAADALPSVPSEAPDPSPSESPADPQPLTAPDAASLSTNATAKPDNPAKPSRPCPGSPRASSTMPPARNPFTPAPNSPPHEAGDRPPREATPASPGVQILLPGDDDDVTGRMSSESVARTHDLLDQICPPSAPPPKAEPADVPVTAPASSKHRDSSSPTIVIAEFAAADGHAPKAKRPTELEPEAADAATVDAAPSGGDDSAAGESSLDVQTQTTRPATKMAARSRLRVTPPRTKVLAASAAAIVLSFIGAFLLTHEKPPAPVEPRAQPAIEPQPVAPPPESTPAPVKPPAAPELAEPWDEEVSDQVGSWEGTVPEEDSAASESKKRKRKRKHPKAQPGADSDPATTTTEPPGADLTSPTSGPATAGTAPPGDTADQSGLTRPTQPPKPKPTTVTPIEDPGF